MRTLTIWKIEECDGGEHQYFKGNAFDTQEAANAYKAKHPRNAVVKQTILIFKDMDDMQENTRAKLRESALAKLTEAEKHALGLKD